VDVAVATNDVSTPMDPPLDVAMGCDCQQCLYAHDNSGPCCCYHCCLYERDQSGQRDTAVATTPEIPSASVAVATNMDHQQEVAWEVYSNTDGDWDDYDEYVNCCLLAEEEGNYYSEDDEEEDEEKSRSLDVSNIGC
jgi:hypothetical protein